MQTAPRRGATPKSLNETPSQKEGKWLSTGRVQIVHWRASMKALPRRKGNSLRAPVKCPEWQPQ